MKFATLPWWVVASVFVLAHIPMTVMFTSPCAVLGITSPKKSTVQRALRQASICTHPDKFPVPWENERATLIFGRVTSAKARIDDANRLAKRRKEEPTCWWSENEVLTVLYDTVRALVMGVPDIAHKFFRHGSIEVNEATFFGISSIVAFYLLLSGRIFTMVSALILRPIPTLVLYVAAPYIRIWTMGRKVLVTWRYIKQEESESAKVEPNPTAEVNKAQKVAGARRRKAAKPDTQAMGTDSSLEDTDTNTSTTSESASAIDGSVGPGMAATESAPSATDGWFTSEITLMNTRPVERRTDYRNWGTSVVQFDFLLHFTKNVIPLLMVTATGQVFSGIVAYLVVGQLLRRVPNMTYEQIHCACFVFGLLHTFLGVSSHVVEGKAGDHIGDKKIDLVWNLGFGDTASFVTLALMGARFHQLTLLGNDPMFTMSFAGGLAARQVLFELSPFSAQHWLDALPGSHLFPFTLHDSSETMLQFLAPIGSCAGGPFRLLFANEPLAFTADMFLRLTFIALAGIYVLQWYLILTSKAKDEQATTPSQTLSRYLLCGVGLILAFVLARYSFNGINSEYSALLFLGLQATLLESFLRLHAVRGYAERTLNWLCFVFH